LPSFLQKSQCFPYEGKDLIWTRTDAYDRKVNTFRVTEPPR
jgi:hypothetical protein